MALLLKKHRSTAANFAGAILFAVLMFVNLQITTNPSVKGDIDLLGVKVSLFTPSAYAYGNNLYAWWDTGRGGGPGGSDLFLCVIPGAQCYYGQEGWGF